MATRYPPSVCQVCGKPLGKNFRLSTVRLVNENGETVEAKAVGFTHAGPCADQFRKNLKDEHPDWHFDDEEETPD